MSTPDQHARYTATPRQCIDCAGKPSAGRPRCNTCHEKRHDHLTEGLPQ